MNYNEISASYGAVTQNVSVIKISPLMQYKKIIAVCSGNNVEKVNV
jgi:hypothetical protein